MRYVGAGRAASLMAVLEVAEVTGLLHHAVDFFGQGCPCFSQPRFDTALVAYGDGQAATMSTRQSSSSFLPRDVGAAPVTEVVWPAGQRDPRPLIS